MSTNLGDTAGEAGFATARCGTCGYDAEAVSLEEAVIALRSFPSQWRRTLAVDPDDTGPESVITSRPSALGWSALEHAGHVRDVLHALDIRLQRIVREDEPVLPETHVTPPAGANEQGTAVVLASLTLSSDQFADTLARLAEASCVRAAHRAGRKITGLDLVREAVHEGHHHLHLATEALGGARPTAGASL